MGLVSACGARSSLEDDAGGPPGRDAESEPDRDCPLARRDGARCELDSVPICPDCPERTRICFYPDGGGGLAGCTCVDGRWVCEPAVCDGWGPDCTAIVHDDACVDGWGCGACCSLAGRPRLGTWCDCTSRDRPLCNTDVFCAAP